MWDAGRVIQRLTRVDRGGAGGHRWLTATRPLHPRLRGLVREIVGYEERTPAPRVRPEMPGATLTCIVEIGPTIDVDGQRHRGGFVAGLHQRPAITAHRGEQAGVQIDLTPLGARRLLADDTAQLTDRVVTLDDLLGPRHRGLGARLAEAPGWPARLDAVERLLVHRIDRTAPAPDWLRWAWRRIVTSGGAVPMGALADELGYSARHVNRVFRAAVGLAPKRYALLVRFGRLIDRLDTGDAPDWAGLALTLGYADQAHLAREVRRFTGLTPTGLAAVRRPFTADVGFVQDDAARLRAS